MKNVGGRFLRRLLKPSVSSFLKLSSGSFPLGQVLGRLPQQISQQKSWKHKV